MTSGAEAVIAAQDDNTVAPAGQSWVKPWMAIALLIFIGILCFVDRFIPSVLAQPIKHELGLSDTMLGFINGLGFLGVYAIVAIPIAKLSDAGKYTTVITISLGAWSFLTMLSGLCQTGWQLALARMGVAIGEAGVFPATYVFISRNFPVARRAAVLSIFSLSIPIGMSMSFIGAAMLGAELGWRMTCIAMGLFGLLLVPGAWFILTRGKRENFANIQPEAAVPGKLLPEMKKHSFVALVLGSTVASFGGIAATSFIPAFLMRSHGMNVGEAGVQFGLLSGIAGVGALLGLGFLADALGKRNPKYQVTLIAVMFALAVPSSIIGFSVQNQPASMGFLAANYAICLSYMALTIAALHRVLPMNVRARGSAVLSLGNAIGGGLGPVVVGRMSDMTIGTHGDGALGYTLLWMVPISFGLAALIFFYASIRFRSEILDEK